jgi:hypothetical protein
LSFFADLQTATADFGKFWNGDGGVPRPLWMSLSAGVWMSHLAALRMSWIAG